MKALIEKINKYKIIEIIAFVIYVPVVTIISINHEFTLDESQSWLIARDLGLIDIIKQMKYEGHPFLWHYLLVPFAKLGFSINSQKIVTLTFAIVTIYFILTKAPFNKLLKILITFSGPMMYYYSSFARSYCMIPLILVLIAILYKDRGKHPYLYSILLGILSNTHLIMMPTAFLLAVTYYYEELIKNRKSKSKTEIRDTIIGMVIMLLLFFIYIVIMILGYQNCFIVQTNVFDDISIKKILLLMKNNTILTVGQFYNGENIPIYFYVGLVIFLMLCLIGTRYSVKQGIIFWSQLIFTFFLHTFLWQIVLATRVYMVVITLMFWIWTYKEDEQYVNCKKNNVFIEIALVIIALYTMPITYSYIAKDLKLQSTSGKLTAEYINENIPENSVFIYTWGDLQQAIIGYLPKGKYDFYLCNTKKFVTFSIWDTTKNYINNRVNFLQSMVDLHRMGYKNIYLITPANLNAYIYEAMEAGIEYSYLYSTEYDKVLCDYLVGENSVIYYIYKLEYKEEDESKYIQKINEWSASYNYIF